MAQLFYAIALTIFVVVAVPAAEAPQPRPNVVVVVVDDLRWDEFGAAGHPYLKTPNIDRLAQEGVRFANAFHAVPLCSPNRASLLTGQYASRHGITDNVARNRASHQLQTFPRALQSAGYETAFVGKWHMGNDPRPRPGFDYWVGLPGQGRTVDPELYEAGQLHTVPGYVTDVLTDRALAFITRPHEQPFLLYLSHKAIHPDLRQLDDGSADLSRPFPYIPAPRHVGDHEALSYPRRANLVASLDDLNQQPALQRALQYRNSPEISKTFAKIVDPGTSDNTIRRRTEMLLAVDESLGRIIETLEGRGELQRTVIIFTSDNGYFYGEHGLSVERRLPYEESIRNPLLVRYPKIAPAPVVVDALVSSIDIAPTVLDLAGVSIGNHVQGRSLVPLMQGDKRNGKLAPWRKSILVEFYTYENPMPWLVDMDYRAVRTATHKYIHWIKHPNEAELYDLISDPYENNNRINDPGLKSVKLALQRSLQTLVLEAMGLNPTQ
jgi:arylsulfatase A-like enzyme